MCSAGVFPIFSQEILSMNKSTVFLNSSLGKKIVMSLSGLFLCSFLVVHLTINLFALKVKSDNGSEFNLYANFMATHWLIKPLEILLFVGFLVHAILGIYLTVKNRQARPIGYKHSSGSANASWMSRYAWLTGIFVGVFLVVHINTFFVQSRFIVHRPMIEFLIAAFSDPIYVAFYIVALFFLAYHVRHGFQSAFQTLGLRTSRYMPLINAIAAVFWLLIPIGFALIPLYFLFAY
jgi:succinate dehydrogenase / fumarate reductase cytochrome b subunit